MKSFQARPGGGHLQLPDVCYEYLDIKEKWAHSFEYQQFKTITFILTIKYLYEIYI